MSSTFRIGAGAGFAGDRLEPAVDLVERGNLDAIVFECLAERTIALAQQAKLEGRSLGYDRRLLQRLRLCLPAAHKSGTLIISNGGAAAPLDAAHAIHELLDDMHMDCKVAAVTGDDVLRQLDLRSAPILGSDDGLWDLRDRIVSANAYLGVEGLLKGLATGAAVVVAGRTADPALFLAPLQQHFGWNSLDYERMAAGTLVGHLLECAGQISGGYFADGDRKVVHGLARLGFPFAEVSDNGSARVTKLQGTGGRVDRATCSEQLLYEVEDPRAYVTPDVVANFSNVGLEEVDINTVQVSGAMGDAPPTTLKVSVGVADGYIAHAEISYAGLRCLERAKMARDVVLERWRDIHEFNIDMVDSNLIGYNSCRPWYSPEHARWIPEEVRLRMSVRSLDRRHATILAEEVEALYTNGPAGGGGVTTNIAGTVGIVSTLIPREAVRTEVTTL